MVPPIQIKVNYDKTTKIHKKELIELINKLNHKILVMSLKELKNRAFNRAIVIII